MPNNSQHIAEGIVCAIVQRISDLCHAKKSPAEITDEITAIAIKSITTVQASGYRAGAEKMRQDAVAECVKRYSFLEGVASGCTKESDADEMHSMANESDLLKRQIEGIPTPNPSHDEASAEQSLDADFYYDATDWEFTYEDIDLLYSELDESVEGIITVGRLQQLPPAYLASRYENDGEEYTRKLFATEEAARQWQNETKSEEDHANRHQ